MVYSFTQQSGVYRDAMIKTGLAKTMKYSPAFDITAPDSAYEKAFGILNRFDRPATLGASDTAGNV